MFNTKSREHADRDIELYKRSEMIKVDSIVSDYRKEQFLKVERIATQSLADISHYEHEYHNGVANKRVELTELQGQIEGKRIILRKDSEYNDALNRASRAEANAISGEKVIKTLEAQLNRQDDNLKVIISKLPKMDVDKIAVSVGPVNANK